MPGTIRLASFMRRWTALAAAALAAPSCSGSEPSAVLVRDSAGVQIVDSRGAAPTTPWRVGPTPLLRIGAVEGEPWEELSGVTGAVRTPSGVVVVADFGSQEVRFFDATGSFLQSVGGRGEGPGEFTGLSALGPDPRGGVWAYDFNLRRITWLGASGAMTGTTTLGPEPPALAAVGSLGEAGFVLRQLWAVAAVAEASEGGLRRDRIPYVRFDGGGSLVDTLAQTPGREVHLTQEGGRGVMTTPLFGRNAVATLREGRLVVGSQDDFVLDEYGTDGTHLRRIVAPSGDLELRQDEVDAVIEHRVADAPPEERASLRSSLAAVPTPERRPAYGAILGDRAGRLWVSEWTPAGQGAPVGWRVFDAEGRWVGDVDMPRGFAPLDIGDDWILGVQRDDLDVEYVVLYPLGAA